MSKTELWKVVTKKRKELREYNRSARGRLNEILEREAQEELDAVQLAGERRYRESLNEREEL